MNLMTTTEAQSGFFRGTVQISKKTALRSTVETLHEM